MSTRKEPPEPDGESNDAASQARGVAAHLAAASAPSSTTPFGTSLGSVSNTQQFAPYVDPNVMMMTNAAATIAAVAASAVQQMTQGTTSQNPSAHSVAQSHSHQGLVAALQGARKPLVSSQPSGATLSPHVAAALLGATPGAQHSIPFQSSVGSSTLPSQLQHAFNQSESTTSVHPSSAVSPTALQAGSLTNALLPQMQSWSVEQLDQHVKLLQQLNQPVPHSVALLLADARRKDKKRTAKRAANRKSASTSRARKKALVEEMTRTNARLRRQALILALLPDLVIAITTEGEITFCSDQVERVLQHRNEDLLGAKLHLLITPASRDALTSLVDELLNADKNVTPREPRQNQARGTKRRLSDQRNASDATGSKNGGETANGNSNVSGSSRSANHSGGDTSAAAIVSEQSFPLSVVEVESKQSARPSVRPQKRPAVDTNVETNENSDTSTSNGGKRPMSSLTNSLSRSPMASSSGEDDGARGGSRASRQANGKRLPSSDDSSSLSSEAKNMRKANENLDRNVRWHNQRMMENGVKSSSNNGPKDDVTGASVTANNATARLSSLKHVPEQTKAKEDKTSRYESTGDQSSSDDSLLAGVEEKKKGESASDDSGYRESNDSREETSSSGSDTSNSNDRRKKPLAPACRMCLIRQDLTTVWCEVTSSIRTRTSDEDTLDAPATNSKSSIGAPEVSAKPEIKELLLCLRPIRDGEKKVDESLRFVASNATGMEGASQAPEGMVSSSSGDARDSLDKQTSEKTSLGSGSNSYSAGASNQSREKSKRPPKKRPLPSNENDPDFDESAVQDKRKRASADGSTESSQADDHEKSVVESLMLMNKSQ